jgi:hypothetical protein
MITSHTSTTNSKFDKFITKENIWGFVLNLKRKETSENILYVEMVPM